MSAGAQLALALGSLGVLLGLLAGVRHLARQWGFSPEFQRKLVHMGTGLYALSLPWLFSADWPIYLLIGLAIIVLVGLRFERSDAQGIGSVLHSVSRRSYGDVLLALSVGLCYVLSDGVMLFYVLPIAVLTIADAAAALVGTNYKTASFKVETGEKSVEGSAIFFLLTWLIAMIAMMLLSTLPPVTIIVLSLMVAAFGTLVEAQSWRGFDNLFLPLGLLVFLSVHVSSTPAELVAVAVIFAVATFAFQQIGPRLGLSPHAARVYAVTLFLVLAVTAPQNAILPGLVLLIHAWVQIKARARDSFSELDIVATIAIISFFWLALGNASGFNAVAFYGMTALGLISALAALALRTRPIVLGWLNLSVCALYLWVLSLSPDHSLWAAPFWPWAVLSQIMLTLIVLIAPRWFLYNRALKLTPLAMALPLAGFVWGIAQAGAGLGDLGS